MNPEIDEAREAGDNTETYHKRLGESFIEGAEPPTKTLGEKIRECFINPGPGRVVVLPDIFTYRGKIFIPDNAKRAGTTGTVLKVGKELTLEFLHEDPRCGPQMQLLQAGDKVVYGTWTGTQLSFDQRPSYRILSETEVLGVLSEEATKLLEVEA